MTGEASSERASGAAGRDRVAQLEAVLDALAVRGSIALRFQSPGLDRLLTSIAEASVALFDAEAVSIALVEADGRLRFRVAAGAQGDGVVGLTVGPGEGIAGFVLATGQALAIANVADDPRFDRAAAARTGYVPRSLLAVPLQIEDRVIGVLEVLDRRDGTFDLRDVRLAGVFARQAATAIDVTRVDRDLARIVAAGIAAAATSEEDAAQVVAKVIDRLDDGIDQDLWTVVDRLARLGAADPDRLAFVTDVLEAAVRHVGGGRAGARSGGDSGGSGASVARSGASVSRSGARSWRERAGLDDDRP
jgi:GAF domain-containing protein